MKTATEFINLIAYNKLFIKLNLSLLKMGRMQMKGKGKGISSSALPYKRKAPKWVTLSPSAVSDIIVKLAKKGKYKWKLGLSPSQIGVLLRD
jgi:small subunit ribosomal protein S13e